MSFLSEALLRPPPAAHVEGPWKFIDPTTTLFPKRVIVHGWPFRKAFWNQRYPGVLAQYREECAHASKHLKVVLNSARPGLPPTYWWIIDHEDAFNPDDGFALAHFFHDYEPGRIVKPAAAALVTLVLTKTLLPL